MTAADTEAPAPETGQQPGPKEVAIDTLARAVLRANQDEFLKAGRARRFAFAVMKWMFLVVFLVALGTAIAAVRIALNPPQGDYNWAHAGVVAGVGVMAALLFAILLYMRPLAALERNSVVQSFLTVVVNSYWTRLLYVKGEADAEAHLEDATAYTVEHLKSLLDRQILGTGSLLDSVRRAEEESGRDPNQYRAPL
jgi:hypothetical protein